MNSKNLSFTFLLALFVFLGLPNASAQGLDFYSRIDDNGDAISQRLIRRHLQDYGTFRDFGASCRAEHPWLDASAMNQEILDEISRNEFGKLLELHQKSTGNSMNSAQLEPLRQCLYNSYQEIKNRSQNEQRTLEVASNIGLFMDGDTKNSDFDIIADIDKINAIIFTKHEKYSGNTNKTLDFLEKFLNGEEPEKLQNSQNNSWNTENNSQNNSSNIDLTASGSSGNRSGLHSENEEKLPWDEICTPAGYEKIKVDNMFSADFARDLNATLSGKNFSNTSHSGQDYSRNIAFEKQKNSQNNIWNNSENNEREDFFDKLPCNGIFCITLGTYISNHTLLVGGNSYAIESILDKHIEKTEKISWSDLSAQKMTNNSFQLPFLNIKFKDKVAGAGVFIHNTPQVTKRLADENTPEKIQAEFDAMMRCAMISAGLDTDENKNSSILGVGFLPNSAVHSENILNTMAPLNPQDNHQITKNNNCMQEMENQIRQKNFSGFSTQINEISAFTAAMLDIINQILDTERKLDSVPIR